MTHDLGRIALRTGVFWLFCGIAAAFRPGAAIAEDETPGHYCARVVNDDRLQPPPASLAAAIKRLFGVSGKYALETSYYRCAAGRVMLCYIGANLPCGKANMSTVLAARQ